MGRPQLRAPPLNGTVWVLVLGAVFFTMGASWGQRRSLKAPAAFGSAAQEERVVAASERLPRAQQAAADLGPLRSQARGVLESDAAKNQATGLAAAEQQGSEAPPGSGGPGSDTPAAEQPAAAVEQPAAAAAAAATQPAAAQPAPVEPKVEVVTRVADVVPAAQPAAGANRVPGMAGRIPKILHHIFIPTISDPSL